MSDGLATITIPDFDDDDYNSSTIPFGRSAGNQFGFGGAFGGGSAFGSSGSGQDSPTLVTPTVDRSDRSYFTSHNRGDSVTSIESTGSATARYPNRSQTSFAHSSHSSIAVSSSNSFPKKSSFASLRNAFKSGKATDTPPVPHLDYQANYVMKNPFNRSTSSLTSTSMTPTSARGASAMSPSFGRPATPGSGDKYVRGFTSKSKSHSYAKSYHSQSGSIFHISDGGSDGHGLPSSPPPVPRVPNGIGEMLRSETPPIPDLEEDKVVMDPKTPSDYALHAVFIRFATSAETRMDAFLREPLDREPLLPDFMGPGVDLVLDESMRSLGKIAQKHAKPVIDSIMRWRKSQVENVGSDIIRIHMVQSPPGTRSIRTTDVPAMLNERKSLASIYIMCRALIAVLQSVPKDALSEHLGHTLETTTFHEFKKPDLKLLLQSANHRTNADLYATLLGRLANVRFESITDRFLAELGPVAHGQVPKDLDMKYENLVRGIRHVQLKVWPYEAFEDGADFLEQLSKSFAHAHGFKLKSAFAETLVQLLHPMGKTAQAETNNPVWAKAIEIIYPKAKEMMSKPRYWTVAFPLVITSLCLAPENYFRKHWVACFEGIVSKLKEKSLRVPIMNGVVRLLWTYLYRCQESASTTTTKLDTLLKHFFPANRTTVMPQDENLDPLIYVVHFVLSRHFEYGRDLCFELIQESAISSANASGGNIANVLASERMMIAVQAIMLSFRLIETEVAAPTWPSSCDYTVTIPPSDYPSSSDWLPPSVLSKSSLQDVFDRLGSTLAIVTKFCSSTVGSLSVLDDQWTYNGLNPSYEESHNLVVRRHPEGVRVAYPSNLSPQIATLAACFQTWPRFIHSSIPMTNCIDMLLRGVIHIEPVLNDAALEALRRFMSDPVQSLTVLARFNMFLFNPSRALQEGIGNKLLVESTQLLSLWEELVQKWIKDLMDMPRDSYAKDESVIWSRCNEIEAGVMFLLSHESLNIRHTGAKIARILVGLAVKLWPESSTLSDGLMHCITLLGRNTDDSHFSGYDEFLDEAELDRLGQWKESKRPDRLLRMVESENDRDRKLWRFIYPSFMAACADTGPSLTTFRDIVVFAASRYHSTISHLAGLTGINTRTPAGQSGRPPDGFRKVKDNKSFIDQWYLWVKILSSTASFSESSRPALTQLGRDHSRAPSDANFERERLNTTRGLFRYLTPFLDSEYTAFRDAAVICISSFPSSAYPQLLEDLSLLAGRQFYDDPRSKAGISSAVEQNVGVMSPDIRAKMGGVLVVDRSRRQERLHSAVARIYYLTAHYLPQQRSMGRQAALANVLKYIRNTQAFLTSSENRDNHSYHRLRRYFCGIVERVFDGLSALEGSERFIPGNMHLALYRLCEEWCTLGPQSDASRQRLITMQRAAVMEVPQSETSAAMETFKRETQLLSHAAVGALASACSKAYAPSGVSTGSPVDRSASENLKPLTAVAVLEKLMVILSSDHTQSQERGKRALKTILSANTGDTELLEGAVRRAYVHTDEEETGHTRFFEVITAAVDEHEGHGFTFAQVVCLGLSNLSHPRQDIRRNAFHLLETIHQQTSGLLHMSQLEANIESSASATHVNAHSLVSEFLAGAHPEEAVPFLAQLARWLPAMPDSPSSRTTTLLLLQSLEFWISNIELMTEDRTGLSTDGHSSLFNLLSISLRYERSHTEQIGALWAKLVEPPHESNGHATVRFLVEQSPKVASIGFVNCASNIVACIGQTAIGPDVFQDLCTLIEPLRCLPTIDHKLAFPNAQDMELWSDLDALFADKQPRFSLGSAQFAWLFLADVALQRFWELKNQLPILLHALFIHIDYRSPFVRQRARYMIFQLLRAWAPGYDELPDRQLYPNRFVIKANIAKMEADAVSMYWSEDEGREELEPKMKWLCGSTVDVLQPLCPGLRELWGSLALSWSTQCSFRHLAFRSLQTFRALMPRIVKSDLANLLGRLSTTIAAPEEGMQAFSSEILLTFDALVAHDNFDPSLLPQMFWCACASLSTTLEKEFIHSLSIISKLLARINLDDPNTIALFQSHRPKDWAGPAWIQPAMLTGLRSSTTSVKTMSILQTLSQFNDGTLIDPSEGRVRDLYIVGLPWFLNAMNVDNKSGIDEDLGRFAERIGELAKRENRPSISKIMTSFAKGHFRTRDDFLRQSVSSLREHYAADYWTHMVTLLLGLVLNKERWLRVQSMQILKVLFQQTRNLAEPIGSELLMPLLRLLETDLAAEALDVLEEPLVMSGGLPAKHVLRMSMHARNLMKEDNSAAIVFGVPEESGWCVVQADSLRETCRANMMGVFDTCSMPSRPSRIDFQPEEVEEVLGFKPAAEEDLGGLVQNLHDLTTFFQDVPSKQPSSISIPNRRLEARVAAILAKSTAAEGVSDVPPTPFVDVFRVGMQDSDDESDDSSCTDSDTDAFIFDSPSIYHSAPNGSRYR